MKVDKNIKYTISTTISFTLVYLLVWFIVDDYNWLYSGHKDEVLFRFFYVSISAFISVLSILRINGEI